MMKARFLCLALVTGVVLVGSDRGLAFPYQCWSPGAEVVFVGFGGPAIARADNGDTVEIDHRPYVGFILGLWHEQDVRGAFVHKDPAGNVLQSGTWTIDDLATSKFWHCSGDPEIDWQVGGRAVLKLRFVEHGGSTTKATLEVANPVGHSHDPAVEGIRLLVGSWGLFFDEPIGGYTFFSIF